MNFSTSKSNLQKALTLTKKAVTDRNIIPIMGCFLFNIEGNKITITGGNMEFYISTAIEVEGSGFTKSIAIPADRLTGLLADLPEQKISFELTEVELNNVLSYTISIKTLSGVYKIPAESGEHYPTMALEDPINFSIPSVSLINGIDKTLFACSSGQLMERFNGVYTYFDENGVNYVGCDGHVLSTCSLFLKNKVDSITGFIIPTKVLSVLPTVECDDDVEVFLTKKNIQFKINENTIIKSLLVNAQYPDHQAIIPIKNDKHAIVNRTELIGALKRVSQFAVLSLIKFVLSEDQIQMMSDNDLGESAKESIKIDYKGEQVIIGLSGAQVIKCLSKNTRENVHLSFGNSNTAILIREEYKDLTSKNNLMLLMPFQLIEKSAK